MTEALHFDPFDYAFHEDPYPVYRTLREQAPAYHNEELGFWALSRHADVLAGFKDTARFSNAAGIALEIGDLSGDMRAVLSILGMDPPEHGRMRGLVSRGFTPRRVAALEPRIRELARGYLRRFRAAGRCEFIEDFAGRMPGCGERNVRRARSRARRIARIGGLPGAPRARRARHSAGGH